MIKVQDYAAKPNELLWSSIYDEYKYLYKKRDDVKKQISAIGAQAVIVSQEYFSKLQTQSQFLKAILYFLEEIKGNILIEKIEVIW